MTELRLLTEPAPPQGVATQVAPGIRRLVANNPGPMTYHGTNTYLLDTPDGVSVLDPGPDSATHVAAILREAGAPVAMILVSHRHADHVGALPALLAATGATLIEATDGVQVGGWTALHTPGHAPDHMCFARADGVVLSADHVMGFATSVIMPPEGDMAAYMAGLRLLLARRDTLYLPGHGPPITDPHGFTQALLDHRLAREASILAALAQTPASPAALVEQLYVPLDPRLRPMAQASVTAHLLKLAAEGRARHRNGVWQVP